ncbi:hypothetical protein MRS44_017192 [Fusarium solani]|uniref:uncharacterized protein n=1 Tax=Fusarium solani TaxID=169388 RepID=UPI0032C4A992|nr:hypothetical protein MRS44_017192 [Fusarium solani]
MEPLSQSPETQEPAVSDAVEVRPRSEPKLAILKRFMGKVGLDAPTLILMFNVLINASMTLGPTIATTAAAEAFVKEQLLAMLLGVGLAAGVSLFVFPISSRMVVMGEFKVLIGLLKKVVGLQKEYLAALAKEDVFSIETRSAEERAVSRNKKLDKKAKFEAMTKGAKAAKTLKETAREIRVLAGKTHGNVAYAKRDLAWGKLDAKDLGDTFTLIRNVTIPMRVLAEVIDQGLEHTGIGLEILPKPKACKKSRSSGSDDVEAHGDEANPGDEGFASVLDKKVRQFYSQNGEILKACARERTLVGGEAKLANPQHLMPGDGVPRNQTQLYVTLYMQQLMHAAGEAVQDFVAFADEKIEDGTMKHERLIFPSERMVWKWLTSIFKQQESGKQSPDILETNKVNYGDGYNQKKDLEHLPASSTWQHLGNGLRKISAVLGSKESAFGFRVACAAMTVGIVAFLEQTQHFFQEQRLDWAMITIALGMTITSGQSIFGFFCRVGGTCLGMIFSLIIWYIVDQKTPGVIVFLWVFFFIEYYFFKFPRFLTAVMMAILTQIVIIAYELQVRRLGEAVATESGQPYYPTYLLAPYRLAVVTGGSLIAFFWTVFPSPLTDRTWLRRDLSAAIYLLANYLSVIISTMQSQLEGTAGDIGSATSPAYHLLSVRRKIFGKFVRLMSSIESHLAWQRWEPTIGGRFPFQTYQEVIMRTARIMSYLTLMSYALTHPPRTHKTEDSDEEQVEDRAAGAPDADADLQDNGWWLALAEVLPRVEPTHHTALSTLTLLSNSMFSGQSLPPYLPLPQPFEMMQRLRQLPKDSTAAESDQDDDPSIPHRGFSPGRGNPGLAIIDLCQEDPGHVGNRGIRRDPQTQSKQAGIAFIKDTEGLDAHLELHHYAEFIAMQVCSTLVCDDLEGLVRAVSGLVGVVDFSFRIETSGRDSRASKAVVKPLAQQRMTQIVPTIRERKGKGKRAY